MRPGSMGRYRRDGQDRRRCRAVNDVRIGQQEVVGLERKRVPDTLLESPELAGPAGGKWRSAHDAGSGDSRKSGRVIAAVVVDNDDVLALAAEGFHGFGHGLRFITGRNDSNHFARGERPRHGRRYANQPEEPAAEQKEKPYRETDEGQPAHVSAGQP